jgi:hypothetical protein
MTDERTTFMKHELMQAIRNASWRIGMLQRQLEDAVAERQRLRPHLRQLEQEAER